MKKSISQSLAVGWTMRAPGEAFGYAPFLYNFNTDFHIKSAILKSKPDQYS